MKTRKAISHDIDTCLDIKRPIKQKKQAFKSNFLREVDDDRYLMLIAEIDHDAIGFISARKDAWNRLFYIEQLHVVKEHRNRGYGSKILSDVKLAAKRLSYRAVFLDLPPQNKRAMRFYLRNGFKRSGQIRGLYNDSNRPNAVVLACKL
jgi:ribosomal protein S18 acetylase RimI-like enzyme